MTERLPIRVQHRRMTAEQWRDTQTILLDGEIGIDKTSGYPIVGDGVNHYPNLKTLRGERGEKGDRGLPGESVRVTNVQKTGKTTRITFSDSTTIEIQDGADGAVTFESLTPQQKEEIRGPQGVPGRDGANGAKGERGEKGADGKSATVYTMTQVQYDQLTTKEPTALYVITG